MFLLLHRFLSVKNVSLFLLFSLILLSCRTLPVNPYNVNNADISILLTSSSGIKNESLIIDTLGRNVEIKVVCKMPEFIDSVRVQLLETNKTIAEDTVVNIASTGDKDTLTFTFSIKTSGDKSISVIGYRSDKTMVSRDAMIKVFESPEQNTKPVIIIEPVNQSVLVGSSAVFSLSVTGTNLKYQWQKNSVDIIGATLSSYTVTPATSADDGAQYRCIVTNDGGADTSALVTLTVKYSVTYNGNGNTGGTVPIDEMTYVKGASAKVPAGTPIKTGYTCIGWNVAADGSGAKNYAAGDTMLIGMSSITLYAKWSATSYFITYDKNSTSASGTMGMLAIASGTTARLTANAFTNSGFSFVGWATTSTGTVTYADGADLTMGISDVTLYAVWSALPKYTVTYNGNGNTDGAVPAGDGYLENATVTVADNSGALAKTGYSFNGWNTKADGSGTAYDAAATFKIGTAAVILYAQWTVVTYKITYYNMDNVTNPNPSNYTIVQTPVSLINPEKNQYTFGGWYDNSSLSGSKVTDIAAGTTGNLNLYAKWSINTYTVTYNGNSNTSGTAPLMKVYEYGADAIIQDNTSSLARTGYTFSGWNSSADGTGTDFIIGNKITITKDTVFYAKWTALPKYTVTYMSNGALTGTVPDMYQYLENDIVTVSANTGSLARRGYELAAWNTKADGSGTDYALGTGTFVMSAVNQTLYARWEIRDQSGFVYHEVKIGNQVWMVENLRAAKYNDSTNILAWSVTNDTLGRFYPGDAVYGAYYNGNAVRSGKLAPAGWKVPSTDDWDTLIATVSNSAISLAANLYWNSTTEMFTVGFNLAQNNSSGFTAIPSGVYSGNATPDFDNSRAAFWTTRFANEEGYLMGRYYYIADDYSGVQYDYKSVSGGGLSVRCLRDY